MIEYTFTPEQEQLRQVVRSFLGRYSTEADVRGLMSTREGYDRALWARMAGELGVQGLAVPEKYDGAGFGPVELGVVLEEAGRALLCAPLLATVGLAAQVLLAGDDEDARADLLPGIADGSTLATVAVTGHGAWSPVGDHAPTAEREDDGWLLDGGLTCVLDGAIADLILVAARSAAGVSLFAVRSGEAGLDRADLPTMDATRKQARVTFARTPARLVGAEGGGSPVLEKGLAAATILLAAEQVGAAAAALEGAVEYAKLRVQYGRVIGSFQGVKHKCADMLVDLEAARSAAYAGLWALQVGDEAEIAVAAAVAGVVCSDAFLQISADAIQVHGGIGFTWEHPAHLYFKRAKSSELLFGTPAQHREALARRLAR